MQVPMGRICGNVERRPRPDDVMRRWTSQPLPVPAFPEGPWERADLEFEDLLHDGPSYAVVLFLNNPDVAEGGRAAAAPNAGPTRRVLGCGPCPGGGTRAPGLRCQEHVGRQVP